LTRYAIGLGSNVGDRLQHLVDAVEELSHSLGEPTVSPVYETEPIGGPDQAPFLNAVAVVETDRDPTEVLDACQQIEKAHGRQRKQRWGPRTLDLDVLATDGRPLDRPELTIPHPRAVEREFVLRPLCDVWPEAPVDAGISACEALEGIGDQGVDYLSDDWVPPVSRVKANSLLAAQLAIFIGVALAFAFDGALPDDGVDFVRVAGAAIAFLGVVLAFIASRRLGTAMTASPIPREGARLVIAGPYRFARHPIYGGLTLFSMGTALLLDSLLGLLIAATLIPFFLFKARYEERQLRLKYADYWLYRQTVRRSLIPFLI
jgi:2-amino-4-hydroxy-6-hydroxymethyldihydropteridine diphosphokinase